MNIYIAFITFITSVGCTWQGEERDVNSKLELVSTILLPGISGRIDHLAYDTKHQIVFMAALGNNSVEVIDLKNKNVLHSIKGLHEPQGVAIIPENNSVLIANGDDGTCDIFNAQTFQKVNSIALGNDADNVRYDSSDNRMYAGYGDGGIAVIDAATFKLSTTIKLSGHPESFQLDKIANKIYVNVPDADLIEVIDLKQNKGIDQWQMTEAKSNYPMALDEINHRLFVGCRHPARLLVLNTETGKTVSSIEIDNDADDVFFNPQSKEMYVSCGSGYLDIIKQIDMNTYAIAERITTHSGARTCLFIPEIKELLIAVPSGIGSNAELLIYQTK